MKKHYFERYIKDEIKEEIKHSYHKRQFGEFNLEVQHTSKVILNN